MSHCENMLSLTPPSVIRTFMVTCTGKTVISTFFTKNRRIIRLFYVSLQSNDRLNCYIIMVTQKEEKQKTSRETLGKFFYDLAKTTFAVMVLGNVATVFIGDTDAVIVSTMIFLGMFITFLFAYVGNKVLKN
mgnify:CR=1 FL=1